MIFFGEDVAIAGGVFAVTPGLYEKYGPGRVFDTPISELAMTGAAYGAAVTGLRPVLEIMFGDFLALSMDCLINQATKYRFLTEERYQRPARDPLRRRRRWALRGHPLADADLVADGHHRPQDRGAVDARRCEGSSQASIRDDNPVIFFEHKRLYSLKGPRQRQRAYELGRAASSARATT